MAEHPDEGTIHTWLDGALGVEEAASLEAHVSTCAACAASVAHARGVIAGASRVVHMLDAAPAPVVRTADAPVALSLWRALRVTPARAAIAAVLIVAVGIALTRDRIAVDQGLPRADSALVATGPTLPDEARKKNAPPAPKPDSVLSAAIARRLAKDVPPRTIESAPGAAVPSAPPSAAGAVATMNMEPARQVAKGRDSLRLSEVVTTGISADKLSARIPGVALQHGAGCYRLEAADGGATWQGAALPLDVSMTATVSSFSSPPASSAADAVGASRFAIVPVNGGEAIGQWSRRSDDTLFIALRGAAPAAVGVVANSAGFAPGALRARAAAPAVSDNRAAPRIVARKITCPR